LLNLLVVIYTLVWLAGIAEVLDLDRTTAVLPSSSSSSIPQLCSPIPSLIAAAAASAAAVSSPTADYQRLYGHLLSLVTAGMSHAPSQHAIAQSDFRYDSDDVGRKLDRRPTAFERYHPYVCRR